MFTPNMDQAVESGKIVNQLKPACLSPCHGNEVYKPDEKYDQYAENWGYQKRGSQ